MRIQSIKHIIRLVLSLGRSSTAKNTYWVFAGDAIFTVTTFIATIFIARALSVAHFGVYVVLLTMIILLLDIADVGVGSALSHFVPSYMSQGAKKKAWSIVKTALLFEVVVGSIIVFIAFIGSDVISNLLFNTSQYELLIRLMSIAGVFALWAVFLGYTLVSLERFPQRAIVNSLPAVLRLAIVIVLFFTKTLTLTTIVVATLISFIPSLLIGLLFIGKLWITPSISISTLRQLLSFSSFIGASRGLTSISSRLDVMMLSPMVGSVETGLYGAASRMTLIFPMIAGSFSSVLAPKLAKLTDYNQLIIFIKKVALMTLGVISLAIFLGIFADLIVPLTFGQEYEQSVTVFRWLLIPNIIFLATIPTVNLIIFRLKKPHIITLTAFFQLIIIFTTNLFLIPKFGRFGPIPGLIIAFSQVLLVTGIFSLRSLRKVEYDKKT